MSAITRNPVLLNLTKERRVAMMADYSGLRQWGCGKAPVWSVVSDQDDWASTTIQRYFRGSKVRFFDPRTKQMGSQPLGHSTLNGALDKINSEHELWGAPPPYQNVIRAPLGSRIMRSGSYRIGFLKEGVECRNSTTKGHVINYQEGRNNPSHLFAEAIVAIFSIHNKPLMPIFTHANAKSLKPLFDKAILKLERGSCVSIWGGQFTKLKPSSLTIDRIKECRVKYEYFVHQEVNMNIDSSINTLLSEPLYCTAKPRYLGSEELDFDALELRLMKLMDL